MRFTLLVLLAAFAVSTSWLYAQYTSEQPPLLHDTVLHDTVKGSIHHGGPDNVLARVVGKVKVLDANTLEYADGTLIDLNMTVPHVEQMAMKGDLLYPCGIQAARFLRELIGERPVACYKYSDDRGPWWGYVDDTSIKHAMVASGWALADHSSLQAAEVIARENKRGLWRGPFVYFDDWLAGVRLPGEPPPPRLTGEQEATTLLKTYGDRETACATLVARIARDLPETKKLVFGNNCQLDDQGLAELAQLPALQQLDLSNCERISVVGLGHLQQIPQLKILSVPPTISDAGMDQVALLSGLSELFIEDGTVTDDGVARLVKLHQLRRLTLSNIRITDAALEHVAKLDKLEELSLFMNRATVTDIGMSHISKLSRLRRLTLVRVQMTDAGLKPLCQLSNLESLGFGGIHLTDAGLVHLKQLTNLVYLDVSDTQITDSVVDELIVLKRLRGFLVPNQISIQTLVRWRQEFPSLRFDGRPEDVLPEL